VLHDPQEVTTRVLRLVADGVVTAVDGSTVAVEAASACVHGDSPGAVEMARAVRAGLAEAGVAVRAFA
jgi:5-oxoprolinase (ATP-hydrolysing) subunit A